MKRSSLEMIEFISERPPLKYDAFFARSHNLLNASAHSSSLSLSFEIDRIRNASAAIYKFLPVCNRIAKNGDLSIKRRSKWTFVFHNKLQVYKQNER